MRGRTVLGLEISGQLWAERLFWSWKKGEVQFEPRSWGEGETPAGCSAVGGRGSKSLLFAVGTDQSSSLWGMFGALARHSAQSTPPSGRAALAGNGIPDQFEQAAEPDADNFQHAPDSLTRRSLQARSRWDNGVGAIQGPSLSRLRLLTR